MKITKRLSTVAAMTILSIGLYTPSMADDGKLPFASEVDSCLSAVNATLNLLDAERVRHVVKQKDRPGLAYAFAIETSVFSGEDAKHYAAYCVASGDGEPSRFRIAEKTS
ncbi:MAG: hypothetical protein OEW68_10685 [Gammaproteobacteria bacterium]|nr:hypothetical protein [Gammaproteobacteria bacterium]MDH4315295.1 hypothetical protein [Gammaproteobacteria bacterium]MDH5213939.1 hypothetical protein [Gammaproteobacteria bacterium]